MTVSMLFVLLLGYEVGAQSCQEGVHRACDPGDGCVGDQECTPSGWSSCEAVCCPGTVCTPPGGQPNTGVMQCTRPFACVCPPGQESICFPPVQPVTFSSSGLGSRDFVATGASAPASIPIASPTSFTLSVRAAASYGATQVSIVGTAESLCSKPGWGDPWDSTDNFRPINITSPGEFFASPFNVTQWATCAPGYELDSVVFRFHGEATQPSGSVALTREVTLEYLFTIRVMTFNLDWGDCGPSCDPPALRALEIQAIIARYADIAGIQEFSPAAPSSIIPSGYYSYRSSSNSGNSIFSKFPILSQSRFQLTDRHENKADLLDVVVDIGGITVRVLTTHGSTDTPEALQQVQEVRNYLNNNNTRMALTADWNLGPPLSVLSDRFQDTYGSRGFQYSSICPLTYNRVDFVFNDDLASQPLVALDSVALCTASPISGHRPIITRFRLVTPPPPPAVVLVTPDRGPNTGGTLVTITGTNFGPSATVTFGGIPATGVTFVNATTLTATTPAQSLGPVGVSVIVNGQSGSLANAFTYVMHPAQIMSVVNTILQ